ncbi:ComF family protein [Planktothrix paucivesiculata]|uniref:Phosphoribosyltransferase n=1 Tax=Planktothrix paucivesiculata PCC 9631 TaxID=671071 RepID=A0A7Z9E0Z4_9CYAN|nr:ComF family protein [Planktothrix paucivesiculata]VXD20287.1 Phosphoribosyltransferase [Planktothrix paucivesiculata PCC 9631]
MKAILSLFLKPNCLLCNRPAKTELCDYCERQLLRCRFPPGAKFASEVPLCVWGQYKDVLKRAIAALKYNNHTQLAKPLGYGLAETWLLTPGSISPVTVVPIPLHPDKLKKRGFNQAELLAKSFCQFTGLSLSAHGLERIKQTEALHELSPDQRLKEMQNVFNLGRDFRRRPPRGSVLILDDIYTTGATVKSAISELEKSGISVAGIVAIATTQKSVIH